MIIFRFIHGEKSPPRPLLWARRNTLRPDARLPAVFRGETAPAPRLCRGRRGGGAERPQPRALVVGRLSWGLGAQGGLVAEWAPLGFPAGGGHLHISCLMSS